MGEVLIPKIQKNDLLQENDNFFNKRSDIRV